MEAIPMFRSMFLTVVALFPVAAFAQTPPVDQGVVQAGVKPNGVAAIVNGENILEAVLVRELRHDDPEDAAKRRPAVLNNLVDLLLIDQYLRATKVDAPATEVDARMKKMQDEAKANGNMDLIQLLAKLGITEAELRTMVTADLRWENFLKTQADEAKLEQFFTNNKIMFDGSQVRARHILISVKPDAAAEGKQAAQDKLKLLKPALDKRVGELMALATPAADPVAQQKAKLEATEKAFGELAEKLSDCPSRTSGGELGWFPRIGRMVENFAAAAFGLEPGQLSAPVETQFGYHVLLVTEKAPGKDVKFAELKEEVREVYGERLKQVMVPQLRQRAQIQIMEVSTRPAESKP
jgi:hypothetical protein